MIHSVSHQAPGEAIDLWAENALVEHPNANFSSQYPPLRGKSELRRLLH